MIVFDTETTGLPKADNTPLSAQPKIIEFAAVRLDDTTLEEVDHITFFANPGQPLEPIIVKITGITDDILKPEKPFAANLDRLCDFFLGEKTLVAHNLAFDRNLLTYELRRLDRVTRFPWPSRHVCTVELTQDITGKYLKQEVLYHMATGREQAVKHRALDDTRGLCEILRWCRETGRI